MNDQFILKVICQMYMLFAETYFIKYTFWPRMAPQSWGWGQNELISSCWRSLYKNSRARNSLKRPTSLSTKCSSVKRVTTILSLTLYFFIKRSTVCVCANCIFLYKNTYFFLFRYHHNLKTALHTTFKISIFSIFPENIQFLD